MVFNQRPRISWDRLKGWLGREEGGAGGAEGEPRLLTLPQLCFYLLCVSDFVYGDKVSWQ